MTTLTTFVLAALAVLLCGPDALHYAKGAPHRWGRVLHLKGDPGAVSLARMDSLDRENAALMGHEQPNCRTSSSVPRLSDLVRHDAEAMRRGWSGDPDSAVASAHLDTMLYQMDHGGRKPDSLDLTK